MFREQFVTCQLSYRSLKAGRARSSIHTLIIPCIVVCVWFLERTFSRVWEMYLLTRDFLWTPRGNDDDVIRVETDSAVVAVVVLLLWLLLSRSLTKQAWHQRGLTTRCFLMGRNSRTRHDPAAKCLFAFPRREMRYRRSTTAARTTTTASLLDEGGG